MNDSRLKEIVELLLRREDELGIQKILSQVHSHLSSIAGDPQDAQHQKNFAETLDRLGNVVGNMVKSFEPAQIELFEEIGAGEYFTWDFPGEIAEWVRKNPITPAVTLEELQTFLTRRNQYIGDITQLRDNLTKLGIAASELSEGSAEIGFLIPRDLFHNELDNLIKELRVINLIIRAFSEAATGSVQAIEVRQISTSDPQFFFGLDPRTIGMIGDVITWGLEIWKRIAGIRKVRGETSATKLYTEEEIKDFFDKKIEAMIDKEIKTKVTQLLGPNADKTGRWQEQHVHLNWTLQTILALLERGLKVEIRALPPPPPEGAEEGKEATVAPEFQKLKELIPQLVFPPVEGPPMLDLPSREPPKKAEAHKRPRAKKSSPEK